MSICLGAALPTTNPPEIYVVCSVSEKQCSPHGRWINATQPFKDIAKQIEEMLKESSVPNAGIFIIKDCRGFGSFKVDKCEDLNRVRLKALLISAYGELGPRLADYYNGDLEEVIDALRSRYVGVYGSALEYATTLFETHYLPNVPAEIQSCIDCRQFQREIFSRDYFSIRIDGSSHIFIHH
jgi:antirestriction protein